MATRAFALIVFVPVILMPGLRKDISKASLILPMHGKKRENCMLFGALENQKK